MYRRNEDRMATMTEVTDSGESSMDAKAGRQAGEERDTSTTGKLQIHHKGQHGGDVKVEKPGRPQHDQVDITCGLVGGAEVDRETLLRGSHREGVARVWSRRNIKWPRERGSAYRMGRLFQSHYRPREGAGPGRKEGELLGDGNSRFGSDKSAMPMLLSLMGGEGLLVVV